MLSIAIFFLFLATVNGDCQNPMFAGPILMPSGASMNISFLAEPQTQVNFGSCTELNGKPSCCDANTWLSVQEDLALFDVMYKGIIDEAEAMTPQAIVDNVCAQFGWTLNPTQYQLALQLATEVKTLIQPSVQCSGGYLGYFQGMLCFGCYPNWLDYYNPTTFVVAVSNATCNGVWDECSWFFGMFQQELIICMNIIIQILQADPTRDYSQYITALNTTIIELRKTTFCQLYAGKDCQSWMCEDIMHGLTIGPDTPPNTTEAFKMSAALLQQMTLLTANLVKNNYTPNGFDAYKIGCNSDLSIYACPAAQHSNDDDDSGFNWPLFLAVFFPILSAIILGVVIYILYKRRKPSESVALDDNVHYAKLTNSGRDTDVAFDPPIAAHSVMSQQGQYRPPQSTGTLQ